MLDHLLLLLVEDNMVNRTLASPPLEMLQRLGCDAMHAGNGVEASTRALRSRNSMWC